MALPEGLTLMIDGETVLVQGRGQALVESKSTADVWYTVELDDQTGRASCTCRGFEIRRKCRHAKAIERYARSEADVRFREDPVDEC